MLLRADFNVPLEPNNPEITSEYDHRLRAALPTVEYLLERNCKVVLCSHLGRPKGRVDEALRLKPVARRLSTLLRPARRRRWRTALAPTSLNACRK